MSEPAPVPADQEEALREEIARFLWAARYGSLPSASWDQAVEIAEDIPDGRAAGSLREMRMQADRLLAGPLATLRAERDQLASELREAREEIRILDIMSETGFDRMMHNGEQRDALAATIRAATDDAAVEAACDAFFSDPVMTWSLAIEKSPELADEVRTRMRASLTAALSDPRQSPAKGDGMLSALRGLTPGTEG